MNRKLTSSLLIKGANVVETLLVAVTAVLVAPAIASSGL